MFGQNGVDFQKISNSLLVSKDSDIDRHFVKNLFRSQGSARQIFALTSQLPYFMITLFSLCYNKL